MQCSNNLKQIGLAVYNFHDTFRFLPPTTVGEASGTIANPDGFANACVLILPFIEQANLYNLWDLKIQSSKQVATAYQQQIPTYQCPSTSQPVLSTGDPVTSGGGLGDYCPNYGTIPGVNNVNADGPFMTPDPTRPAIRSSPRSRVVRPWVVSPMAQATRRCMARSTFAQILVAARTRIAQFSLESTT